MSMHFSTGRFFLILSLTLALGATLEAQTREVSETVPLNPGDKISMKTFKGSIHITRWDRAEVAIFARITPPDGESSQYAAQVVEATRVEIRRSGNTVVIRSDYDDVPYRGTWFSQTKNLAYVNYDIKAPRDIKLRLDDYKSSIEMYGLAGEFDVTTYKGDLIARELTGRFRLETYKGKAEITAVEGSLDVETFKGEVAIQALRIDDDSKLETYKGNIELSIPANQGVDLKTDLGKRASLASDFNLELESERRRSSEGRIERTLNNGGPQLLVKSYKGEIRLKRW